MHDGTIHLLGRRAISRVAPREDDVGAPARGSYDLSGQAFKLTKRKSAVSVLTNDGEVFEGHFFVTGDQRLSELLNRESVFFPFEFLDGKIHLIHRSVISRVIPREEDGGAPTEGAYYVLGQTYKLTKRKSAVSVVAEDGQILEGNFFVTGDQRLSDLLNGRNAFVPFEIHGATIHLLARSAISRVVPREDDSGASTHVYQAQVPFKQPKRKTAVSLVTKDGEFFEGHIFVARDQRASDVLNDGSLFVPFEFLDGKIHLIHRSTISRVVPREEEGGASEGVYFAQETFSQSKRKSPILVVAKDDEAFEGHFSVGGTERISDLLNAESEFVPFELLDGTIHLLARSAIRRVVPRKDDGGESGGSYFAQASFKQPKRRFPAAVITKDDEVFEGHFFVPGRQRLSQVLKVENAFVPFELLDGTIQLLNRSTINRVVPREDEDEDEDEDEPSAEFVRDVFRGSAREGDLVMEGAVEDITVDDPATLAEAATDADLEGRTGPARGRSRLHDPIGWAGTQWDRTRDRTSGPEIVALAGATVLLLIVAIIASTMWIGDGERGDVLPEYQNGMAALASADYETARGVFRPLAEQGVVRAQVQLALMHENGYGVPQDYVEARNWYLKAAAEGDVQGQLALGRIYFMGLGVSQDLVRAYMWFILAAEKGDASAMRYRNDARAVMTGPEIGEAERRVREWRERHQASE